MNDMDFVPPTSRQKECGSKVSVAGSRRKPSSMVSAYYFSLASGQGKSASQRSTTGQRGGEVKRKLAPSINLSPSAG